ncbi:MAG: Queuosine biosynthesis protein [Gemmatimonadetes bacterium]|nr:Queuosine biosynthesis protein [Gemmatimonadota bacterium]
MSAGTVSAPLPFTLPADLEANEPIEARSRARDEVRMLVSYTGDDAISHASFTAFPDMLRPADVVIVNTSATVNAALPGVRPDGERVEVRLSQRLADGDWVVELRRLTERDSVPLRDASAGEVIALPANASVRLASPYSEGEHVRLWRAEGRVRGTLDDYLDWYGVPIRYGYVTEGWPLAYYQTIFAREPGSAEMPSAARPFSRRVVTRLARRGIAVAPILLHTGVASLEDHEAPYPEYFRVSASTARVVNEARARGGRAIAVGTTAVRALESATCADGIVSAHVGWTELVVTAERGLHAVDGLLTGFHEPRASHLAILDALAGRDHVETAYASALRERYLWHEFGDVHLLLPGTRLDG